MILFSVRLSHILVAVLALTSWTSQRYDTRSMLFVTGTNSTTTNITATKNSTTTAASTSAAQVSKPAATTIDTPRCFSSISQIVLAEALVKDTSVVREYVMCENVRNTIVKLDFYKQIMDGGQSMVPLRPNMHLKCGEGGRRDGNCIFSDGDILLDGTSQWGITDSSLDGVIIEGFTFVAAGIYAAELTKPGRVLFRDCVFKVRRPCRCFFLILLR
jgi:hypothetical protein